MFANAVEFSSIKGRKMTSRNRLNGEKVSFNEAMRAVDRSAKPKLRLNSNDDSRYPGELGEPS